MEYDPIIREGRGYESVREREDGGVALLEGDPMEAQREAARRRYEGNVERIFTSAERQIETAKQEAEKNRQTLQIPPRREHIRFVNLADISQELEKGLRGKAKTKLKSTLLRTKGIQHPDQLLPLLHYLEHDFIQCESSSWAKKNEVETGSMVQDKTQVLRRMAQAENGDVLFSVMKRKHAPFKLQGKEVRKMEELLGKSNDPIETIERLRLLGFSINRERLSHELECIKDFVSSEGAMNALKAFNELEMHTKGNYFGANAPEVQSVKALAEHANGEAPLLSDEHVEILWEMKHLLKTGIPLDREFVEHMLAIASDENLVALAQDVAKRFSYTRFDQNPYQLAYILELKKAGISEDFVALLGYHVDISVLGFQYLFTSSAQTPDEIQRIIEGIKDRLGSSAFKRLLTDKNFGDFVGNIQVFSGTATFYERDIQILEKYFENGRTKELISASSLLSQWGAMTTGAQFIEAMNAMSSNEEWWDVIVRPEFDELILAMREKLGFTFPYHHALYQPFWKNLYELYGNRNEQNLLLSEGQKLVNYIENFDIMLKDSYLTILRINDFSSLLEEIFDTFLQQRSKPVLTNAELRAFIEIGRADDLREQLFNPKSKALVDSIEKNFSYNFKLEDWKGIVKLLNDNDLQERLFDDSNQVFIHELVDMSGYAFSPENLMDLTSLEEEKKTLIQKFHEDFSYKFRYPPRRTSPLDSLIDDKELQRAAKEEDEEAYKAGIYQKVCRDFISEGDPAHDVLEKIKEKQWITIQTYNRLYAARRRSIGFKSYAFPPAEFGQHPIINTTFYGNSLLEVMNAKDKLIVEQKEDAHGFFTGAIGMSGSIKIYPELYAIYQQAITRSSHNHPRDEESFLYHFSWFDPPKVTRNPKNQRLLNQVIPLGVALNGHTHFYATPYGIVSGCVSENPQASRILEKEHNAAQGVGIVTGHREMLVDFLKRQRGVQDDNEDDKPLVYGGENAITIDFEDGTLPAVLKEMLLPPGITLNEVLLNLHIEQFLHDNITYDRRLLFDLLEDIRAGEKELYAGDKRLNLNDILPAGTKIILKQKSHA